MWERGFPGLICVTAVGEAICVLAEGDVVLVRVKARTMEVAALDDRLWRDSVWVDEALAAARSPGLDPPAGARTQNPRFPDHGRVSRCSQRMR